jgi:hypothetical protein
MDDTRSMGNCINSVKTSISEMYEKAEAILNPYNIEIS